MERFNWPEFIVDSRLRDDFYNFTQGQFIFHGRHGNTPVTFRFVDRTKKGPGLAKIIDQPELEKQLKNFESLLFTGSELDYMAGLTRPSDGKRIFQDDYLNFLWKLIMPACTLSKDGDEYQFEVRAPWREAVYWEVPALQIFTQLYTKRMIEQKGLSQFQRDLMFAAGVVNQAEKHKMLRDNPDISFVEFGTRRAANGPFHEFVIKSLKAEVRPEQFLGTSNTYYAMEHDIRPMGTNSHASYQVYSALFPPTLEGLIESQRAFLCDWYQEYGPDLAIFLPDTFTSDFFLNQVMTEGLARMYKGARQDSGSPYDFADKQTSMYQRFDIDSSAKLIFPSDGLDDFEIPRIRSYVGNRMQCGFGWGSNLSNDLGNPELGIWAPPNRSLVIKAVEANGRQLVKLSDNPAKAIGDVEEIARIKKLIGCRDNPYQSVRY